MQKSLLVRTGYGAETEQKHADKMARAVVVDECSGAAEWILRNAMSG